jgi:hypothetical protein
MAQINKDFLSHLLLQVIERGSERFPASSDEVGRFAANNRNGVSRLQHDLIAFGRNSHFYR